MLGLLAGPLSGSLHVTQSYMIDIDENLSIDDLIVAQKSFTPVEKDSIGFIATPVWTKIKVVNSSDESVTRRFYNKRAGMDFIDVYVTKDEQLQQQYRMGDLVDQDRRDNPYRLSYFDLTVGPAEELSVYIKHNNYAGMEIKWENRDLVSFESYYGTQSIVYAIVFGMMVILVLLALVFFIQFRDVIYFFYLGFISIITVYQLALAGFLYQLGLDPYINTVATHTFPAIAVFFLGYFPFYFFDVPNSVYNRMPFIFAKLFSWIMLVLGLLMALYVLYPPLLYLNRAAIGVSLVVMLSIFWISVKTFLTKEPGSFFYFFSNLVLIVSISYFLLGLLGKVPTDELFYYALAGGSIGQVIFIGLSVATKTFYIKKENRRNKEMLQEYANLSFLGQTFLNIYHQWKMPVNNIFNCIGHIETAKEFHDKDIEAIVDENLKQIKDNAYYLRDTAINYLKHYKHSEQSVSSLKVLSELRSIIRFLSSEVEKKHIDILIECDENLMIATYKNYFDNLFMILLDNSLKVFSHRQIEDPAIKIGVMRAVDEILVVFQDNGGGIRYEPLEKIFEKGLTLSGSTGIGLYMAKNFLVEQLRGKISVRNKAEGAVFEIILPLTL